MTVTVKRFLCGFMKLDFLSMFFKELLRVASFAVLHINIPGLGIVDDVLLQNLYFSQPLL